MKFKNIKIKTKIIFVLILSFILVSFISPQIFITNSPKLRNDIGTNLVARVRSVVDGTGDLFSGTLFAKMKVRQELEKKPLLSIGKGVYARSAEEKNISMSETVIKEEEVEWLTCPYNIIYQGKPLIIRTPKTTENQNCMGEELVKEIYK